MTIATSRKQPIALLQPCSLHAAAVMGSGLYPRKIVMNIGVKSRLSIKTKSVAAGGAETSKSHQFPSDDVSIGPCSSHYFPVYQGTAGVALQHR